MNILFTELVADVPEIIATALKNAQLQNIQHCVSCKKTQTKVKVVHNFYTRLMLKLLIIL